MKKLLPILIATTGIILLASCKKSCFECQGSTTFTTLEACENSLIDISSFQEDCESSGGTWVEK